MTQGAAQQSVAEGKDLPFDLENVLLASHAAGEPAWLTDARSASFAGFVGATPGFGRYSHLRLDWRSLERRPPQIGGRGPLPAKGLEILSPSSRVARLEPLSQWCHRAGADAFGRMFRMGNPWDDLVLAAWEKGSAVTWPSSTPGGSSPIAYLPIQNAGGMVLEPLLLDVGEGREAALFLHWKGGDAPGFHLSTVGGRVGDGGSLKVFILHEGGQSHHHLSFNLTLGRDSRADVFTAWVGGKWTLGRFHTAMDQPGASWRESHMILMAGKEHFDLDSQVRHGCHRTHSDVQVRTVASASSRAVFTGNILMDREAQLSEAYLADHTLLLSPEARADSIPGLEILAQDVKAAHAATMGQVDEEQLFYLESRGLDPARARHLCVVGFLESLFERVPFPLAAEVLDPVLEGRVSA